MGLLPVNAQLAAPSGPAREPRRLAAVEFYAGIGGFAAAVGEAIEIVAAVDINRRALEVYGRNFAHRRVPRTIESIPTAELQAWDADLWWLSPPCQPFTRRGKRGDVNDPRSASFVALVEQIRQAQPPHLALENVPDFAGSRAYALLHDALSEAGYHTREVVLCPTQLGAVNRRRRFYLAASLSPSPRWGEGRFAAVPSQLAKFRRQPLSDFLDETWDSRLEVDPEMIARYRGAVDIVDADDPQAVCSCFTSAYGRSPVRSGSYLKSGDRIRRFSPREILRMLGFPPEYRLAPDMLPKQAWPLAGNSLSVTAVRAVLKSVFHALTPESPAPRGHLRRQ